MTQPEEARLPDPYCTVCHGEGYYWEDVSGDGGGRIRQECECLFDVGGFALDMSDAHDPKYNEKE